MSDAPTPARFDPSALEFAIIAVPLLRAMDRDPDALLDVIIDVNRDAAVPRDVAKQRIVNLVVAAVPPDRAAGAVRADRTRRSTQYVYARLRPDEIRAVARDQTRYPPRATTGVTDSTTPEPTARVVHRIWLDHPLKPLITHTAATVNLDAARAAFDALGDGVVWAVIDSGVDGAHPHFQTHGTLAVAAPLRHHSFIDGETDADALRDDCGHGTHVAGIIAGELAGGSPVVTVARRLLESGDAVYDVERLPAISGMAPRCTLVSFKVLDAEGNGLTSNILAAIDEVLHVNGDGPPRIHGVNLSVGYDFDPEWFACGQSPLCVEVDRLVRSGVVVVVAAGNTGFGYYSSAARGPVAAALAMTINDPGNAELAITVGSTHRDEPETYGVSYFSSKGPTGDGRHKPDLVAPGEKILSCASAAKRAALAPQLADALAAISAEGGDPAAAGVYVADSGTSMAAPHVSGAIAAFLSVRPEFVGRPHDVKQVFLDAAVDLRRDPYFQGRGLVDVMGAIQAV
ncbi:hypothetical protein tb265_17210 [Gemmatimonadetes bacterium T265]|nr:hypothetical protein tb265_17210 [Gemmatimonadetes bacterium T265]